MTAPKKQAPAAMARSGAQENRNDTDIIAASANAIKARLVAGEFVGALDYPEADRPQFWAVIAIVRDDMPCVRPIWRTIGEQHVDGIRVRQKMFSIRPRRNGAVTPTLADQWGAADHLARQISSIAGPAKHEAISALLSRLLDLLRGAAWN